MSPSRRTPHPRLRAAHLLAIAVLLGTGACGGGAGIGERCDSLSECASHLQCLNHICVPRCDRHADCGDGHVCRTDGICEVVETQIGDRCLKEIECGPGQFCQLGDSDLDGDGFLIGSCQAETSGGVLGDLCTGATQEEADAQCRTGTCALGRCVYLCVEELDCPAAHVCSTIPRELPAPNQYAEFYGCLPDQGDIVYSVPTDEPFERLMLPVPGAARSVAVVMSVEDDSELVGAVRLDSPSGEILYQVPLDRAEYFANQVRHLLAPGVSVLVMPQVPEQLDPDPDLLDDRLVSGAYVVSIGSYVDPTTPGTQIPKIDIIYKLDSAVHLDIHFYFLDLGTHPCPLMNSVGDAVGAQSSTVFQTQYLAELDVIFASAGVILDSEDATYTDILDRGDLDGLDQSRLGDLLALSSHEGGVHVFFVRSISPAGIEGLVGGPPAPPGVPGSRASGVAIATDTLCYADWNYLARTTAHEIARALGLQRSVEPDGYEDALTDPTTGSGYEPTNLMYFSDNGDSHLSTDQARMLRLSPVMH